MPERENYQQVTLQARLVSALETLNPNVPSDTLIEVAKIVAVTTFSLSIMVTAYGSATTNVTPRATRLVVEDVTTQNVLATFIGSFLLKWSTKTGHRVRVFPVSIFRFVWGNPPLYSCGLSAL